MMIGEGTSAPYPMRTLGSFLATGFAQAHKLTNSSGIGEPIREARQHAQPPGMFCKWASMSRFPDYKQHGHNGIRVDIVHTSLKERLLSNELPKHWLILEREPTKVEVCSFCCVWLADRNAWVFESNFEDWLRTTGRVSVWDTPRCSAYSQFVSEPALLTSSAIAELGCYVWTPVEELFKQLPRVKPRPMVDEQFDELISALRKDDRKAAGAILDSGSVFGARKLKHKRSHNFDLATVVHCAAQTWAHPDNPAAGELFWSAVSVFLFEAGMFGWRYELVLFTFCQLFGDKFWATKLSMYLSREMMSLDDQGWLVVCKQITTFVGRSFCVPFTNWRSDASLSFMYLEDMLGPWSYDMNPERLKTALLNIVHSKLRPKDSTLHGDEERYYGLFEKEVRSLVEPIVGKYSRRMVPWDDFVLTYGEVLSSGHVRKLDWKDKACTTSSRSYVAEPLDHNDCHVHPFDVYVELAVKFNEKGQQRHLMARDFAHHAREKWFCQLFANHGELHGGTSLNCHTLMNADHDKFDEEVECKERLIIQDTMFKILLRLAPKNCHEDVETIGRYMIEGELAQMLRTSHLRQPEAKAEIDELNKTNENLQCESDDNVRIRVGNCNFKNSDTYWTLGGNTYVSRRHMHARDSLLRADERHPTLFNRSDDISEWYRTWESLRQSNSTFASLGLLVKAEKQYIDGAILGAPGCAIYSLMHSQPKMKHTPVLEMSPEKKKKKKKEREISPEISILAAISDACSMAVRCGMDGLFIMHLYNDAEDFYRKIRERRSSTGGYRDIYVSKGKIGAPREQGGYGVLQPWEIFYDLA